MQLSINWLKDYVEINVDPEELAQRLTMLGLETKSIRPIGADIQDVFVGKILSIEPHPDADKLVVCKTDLGEGEPLRIICGARNMQVGDLVPTAKVGGRLAGGLQIGRRKIRGVESFGMMCSPKELGMGEDHTGLLILPSDLPIGADVKPYLGLDDVILELEITPNRNDWAGMIGIAREIAAYYDKPLRFPDLTLVEENPNATELSSVTIEAPDLCPRYAGRVLTDVRIGPSPHWLAQRLNAAGLRPINNVVDVTNYVLIETGHPLHAFDYNLLVENRIVVRTAKTGEIIFTIDQEKRSLTPDMLVIADAKYPVAIAGIMGGHDTEVSEKTTHVFLESAYFDPVSIRRTARTLGMTTEASQRFQRGADPEMVRYAIDRTAQLIRETAGGRIARGVLDEYPKPLQKRDLQLRYDRTRLLLGTDVSREAQRTYLTRLGFRCVAESETACTFAIPSWRHDCRQEADLIEEIARLHGYDKIPPTLPAIRQTERIYAPQEDRVNALRRCLVGLGLTEIITMSFGSPDEVSQAGLDGEYLNMVALENPLSENHSCMRSSLIPGLVRTVIYNIRHGAHDLVLFEIGPVYRSAVDNELPPQMLRLGVAMTGLATQRHWSRQADPVDFYDLKAVAETVLEFFRLEPAFEPVSWPPLEQGLSVKVVADGHIIGYLGRLDADVQKAFDLDQDTLIMELDLDTLLKFEPRPVQHVTVSPFPPSLRDIAVIVQESVPAHALRAAALGAGGKYLKKVEIFDVYTGKPVPPGKKSVAMSLVFQSEEETLTDKLTQKAVEKIVKKLGNEFDAELR